MIVLTGGAGFIGSCLLKKLNDKQFSDILVVDHLGTQNKWKNLVDKRFNNFVHKSTFRHKLATGDYGNSIDAIFHLGACSVTTERDADYIMDNNLSYSIELAEYALKHNIRFIYAGSAASYGDGAFGYSDNEFDNLKPLNAYGLSKHLFDQWVLSKGLEKVFTGLKFFNVFGPNEYHKGDMASMIFKSYKQIKETGQVQLFRSNHPDYTDGGQMRDFIYVKDIVDVMMKMFSEPNFAGIYNLGTGQARSWNDLMKAVFKAMDKEPVIEYKEMPDSLVNQYQNYTQAEMDKLSATSCGIEFSSLEDSVDDYVKSYLSQADMYM
jgi:ADP-L-glycero-D-manno-heptose 6-epimerase